MERWKNVDIKKGQQGIKVIRFDPLAPAQTLAQRYTLQMKMFIFINYIMNLNCSCQKIVFSLLEVWHDMFCAY